MEEGVLCRRRGRAYRHYGQSFRRPHSFRSCSSSNTHNLIVRNSSGCWRRRQDKGATPYCKHFGGGVARLTMRQTMALLPSRTLPPPYHPPASPQSTFVVGGEAETDNLSLI